MCFNPTQNNTHFCNVHQKMQVDKAIQLFGKMNTQIKQQWPEFIRALKDMADPDN